MTQNNSLVFKHFMFVKLLVLLNKKDVIANITNKTFFFRKLAKKDVVIK